MTNMTKEQLLQAWRAYFKTDAAFEKWLDTPCDAFPETARKLFDSDDLKPLEQTLLQMEWTVF